VAILKPAPSTSRRQRSENTLAVHINATSSESDWEISDDGIVGRGLDSIGRQMKDGFKNVRWHLDRRRRGDSEKPANI